MPTNIQSQWFGTSGGDLGDPIEQSLRFNSLPSLIRTATGNVTGDWTLSYWFKTMGPMSSATDAYHFMFGPYVGPINLYWNNYIAGSLDLIGKLGDVSANFIFDGRLRDPAAWYHIVIKRQSNVLTGWVNGVSKALLNNASNFNFSTGDFLAIGDSTYTSGQAAPFDGYMADWHFVDGQAKDATDFGKYNADGVWVPITYTGTYGSQGFHLTFDSSQDANPLTGIGIDSSGNNNHFVSRNTVHSWAPAFETTATSASNFDNDIDYKDTPTSNYATMNSLYPETDPQHSGDWYEGNLKHYGYTASTAWSSSGSTIYLPKTGKWYAEFELTSQAYQNWYIGVLSYDTNLGNAYTGYTLVLDHGNNVNQTGSNVAQGSGSWSQGDVCGVAVNMDTKHVEWFRNGTSVISYTSSSSTWDSYMDDEPGGGGLWLGIRSYNYNNQMLSANFGQRPFIYTPPAGYKALQSNNLPEPGIKNGKKHFDAVSFAGQTAAVTVPGLEFQPDLVWIKSSTHITEPAIFDSVRGAANGYINTHDTSNPDTSHGTLTSFNSDGFTVGATVGSEWVNGPGRQYSGWCWKAGDTPNVTYTVKVVSSKFRFDDFAANAVTLDLEEGGTYVFDQSDSSNASHPLRFSTTSDGTHGGGSEYTTGVVTEGIPGQAGAKTTVTVAAGAPTLHYYCSAHSGMGGQANTNTTKGSSNFAGTIQSKVSANTDAGFSIVQFQGTGAIGTIGHGLGKKPHFIWVKRVSGTGGTGNHSCWHISIGANNQYQLNSSNSASNYGAVTNWNSTAPSATVVSLGANTEVNSNGDTYMAYIFAPVDGYSKFGRYRGNNVANGPFVYTGFKPRFIMLKTSIGANGSWQMYDTVRDSLNPNTNTLTADSTASQVLSGNGIDILSNGFKVRDNGSICNGSSQSVEFSYLAFAEYPFGGENTPPLTGVF